MSVIQFPLADKPLKVLPDGRVLPEAVLGNAFDADLEAVVVCGLNKDGTLYTASTSDGLGDTLLLLARTRQCLMDQFHEDRFA